MILIMRCGLPKTVPVNAVRRFLIVDEIYIQLPVPFFRELMAWMISLLVGTSVLMSRSVVASWMFGTTVGLFKSSLKCSVQRRCCSPSDVSKIPFLSFTSTLVVWHLPVMVLLTLYTVPCSLRAAVYSA